MKSKIMICLWSFGIISCFYSTIFAAEVSQGKCVSYDKAKHKIVMNEYNLNFSKEMPYGEPTAAVSEFDVTNALVGVTPQPGDILRIAFDMKSGQKHAVKIMNVSKQDLKKK